MRVKILSIAIIGACLLASGISNAQQPSPTPPIPNPLDTIPDAMPFDVPYGAPISLDRAGTVIAAAVAEAKKRNWKMKAVFANCVGGSRSEPLCVDTVCHGGCAPGHAGD